jgi:adenylate cyclase
MKLETKILLVLTVAALIPLIAAIIFLRPDMYFISVLLACGVLAVLISRRLLGRTIFLHYAPASSIHLKPDNSPQRTGEPENLMDRLVSVTEEFITNIGEKNRVQDNVWARQELYRHLGNVVEKTIGFPVGTHVLDVTILLSDLRGFSVITENYPAGKVVEILNRYFTHMCEIIYRYGGIVDKFMGDSIMAIFMESEDKPNYIEQAVCCAVEMQIAMDSFNKENSILDLPNLYMGIGINTGQVVAGRIGSDLHSEYTVIGDEVTLASRIEAYTLRGQILLSEKTFSEIKDLVKVENPIYVSVKGKLDPTPLYELLSIGEPYNLGVPAREARRSLRVEVNIPFEFQICEGKIIQPDTYEGRILNISSGGMFASTLVEVEPYCNIRFRLEVNTLGMKGEYIYGKILRVQKESELYEIHIEFTFINSRDKDSIKEIVYQIVKSSFQTGQ